MLRRLLLLATLAVAGLLSAAPAHATSSSVAVGIANQTPDMFDAPAWQALGMTKTRYFIKWNAIQDPSQIAAADAFVNRARTAGVSVLMHISTEDFTPGTRLPSRTEYKANVGRLIDRYFPVGVREWGVWNEANDRTQPTYKSPTRAADFFKDMYGMLATPERCGPAVNTTCKIVALDMLDGYNKTLYGTARSYVTRFYKRLSPSWRKRASIVGIHNYSDTNRNFARGTTNIIREVKRRARGVKVRFWITETGGVVRLGESYKCDAADPKSVAKAEARGAKGVKQMFKLALRFRKDVDRLYPYQWSGSDCDPLERFDAGLVHRDGTARPSFTALTTALAGSTTLTR